MGFINFLIPKSVKFSIPRTIQKIVNEFDDLNSPGVTDRERSRMRENRQMCFAASDCTFTILPPNCQSEVVNIYYKEIINEDAIILDQSCGYGLGDYARCEDNRCVRHNLIPIYTDQNGHLDLGLRDIL